MIELLYRETCPYSQKVLQYIDRHDLKDQIELRSIEDDPKAMEKLHGLTGGGQVPCLVLDEKPMLESEEVIHYLEDNYVKGAEKH